MKKNLCLKKAGIVVFVILTISILSVCSVEASSKKVKNKVSIYIGNTITLKVKNAKKIKWKSTKKSVATVSQKGKVKGKKVGQCIIVAKVGKKTYKCKVTVKTRKRDIANMILNRGKRKVDEENREYYYLERNEYYQASISYNFHTTLAYYPDVDMIKICFSGYGDDLLYLFIEDERAKYCDVIFIDTTSIIYGSGHLYKNKLKGDNAVYFGVTNIKDKESKQILEMFTTLTSKLALIQFSKVLKTNGLNLNHENLGFHL